MAVPESRSISLHTCLEVTKFLASLVEDSYSHPKSSALILNSTGEVYFTRSGVNIITETYCCHPIAKLITDALWKHHALTGDGSKSYILLLHEILLAIKNKYKSGTLKTEHRIEISEEISQLIYKFLPPIFRCLRERPCSVQYFIGIDDTDSIVKTVRSIIETFFQYKFTAAISQHLSCLIADLICRSISHWKELPFLINYLISNFSILCSKAVASIQESYVVEGIVIKGTLLSKFQNHVTNKSFIIIHDIFKNMYQCNVPILLQNDSSVKQSFELSYRFYAHVLSILTANDVSVLLSTDSIPEEFASLCSEKNVLFIDRICEEQMEHVVNGTGVVPLHDFSEGIRPENIGHADFIKILIFGQNKFIHIGLPSKLNGIVLHHVMLSAPFENLYRECYNECINSLKVIRQWIFSVQQCRNRCSCLTQRSYPNAMKHDFSECVLTSENTTHSLTEYSDFTNFDSSKHGISSAAAKGENRTECSNNKPCCTFMGVAYPVGFWEILLNNALSSVNGASYPQLKNSILSLALTEVTRKTRNPKNCVHTCKKIMNFQKYSDLKTEFSISDANLEPVASKEKLIFNVLNLVIQLIRLDALVNVKQLHNTDAL